VETRRVTVEVYGLVQGVGFRASCARRARALGLGGWVRNRADGAVLAVFEGDGAAVAEMLAWCRSGPSFARVEHVDVDEETPTGEGTFAVR